VKRLLVLFTVAALFAVGMAVSAVPAFGAPCANPKSHNPHCVTLNPGGQPHGCQHNPNCTREFENPSPNR
jgi:hypothetical protein